MGANDLDDSNLVGNIEGIVVLGETDIGLLLAVRPARRETSD